MPVIHVQTFIRAPVERCFDLARDPDLHVQSTEHTEERLVERTGEGLFRPGDRVTWEAVHFRVRQRLTSRITRFEPPRLFEDRMVRGAFHSFAHLHEFRPVDGGTVMTDTFTYRSPLGVLGVIADHLFLERYMRRFLIQRAQFLKQRAESGGSTIS
jgi:ligand-binding SRPBCC domain-containing protein